MVANVDASEVTVTIDGRQVVASGTVILGSYAQDVALNIENLAFIVKLPVVNALAAYTRSGLGALSGNALTGLPNAGLGGTNHLSPLAQALYPSAPSISFSNINTTTLQISLTGKLPPGGAGWEVNNVGVFRNKALHLAMFIFSLESSGRDSYPISQFSYTFTTTDYSI